MCGLVSRVAEERSVWQTGGCHDQDTRCSFYRPRQFLKFTSTLSANFGPTQSSSRPYSFQHFWCNTPARYARRHNATECPGQRSPRQSLAISPRCGWPTGIAFWPGQHPSLGTRQRTSRPQATAHRSQKFLPYRRIPSNGDFCPTQTQGATCNIRR